MVFLLEWCTFLKDLETPTLASNCAFYTMVQIGYKLVLIMVCILKPSIIIFCFSINVDVFEGGILNVSNRKIIVASKITWIIRNSVLYMNDSPRITGFKTCQGQRSVTGIIYRSMGTLTDASRNKWLLVQYCKELFSLRATNIATNQSTASARKKNVLNQSLMRLYITVFWLQTVYCNIINRSLGKGNRQPGY